MVGEAREAGSGIARRRRRGYSIKCDLARFSLVRLSFSRLYQERGASLQVAAKKLLVAAFLEGLAILAGLFAYVATGNWIWIAIGVLGGLGFSLPAAITFIRASMGERDRASR